METIGDFGDGYKWHGGTIALDGCIYAVPSHSEYVLKIIPPEKNSSDSNISVELLTVSDPSQKQNMVGTYKWAGGAQDRKGNIYGVPDNSQCVIRINPFTGEVITFGQLPDDHNKWKGAILAPNGMIYCVPCNAESVLVIDPYTLQLSNIGVGVVPKGRFKWQGAFVGKDNNVYILPETASGVLKIIPDTNEVILMDSVSSFA